jgi:aubergine
MKELLGQVVLTRYNNRTYRIDDIAWDLSPRDRFTKKTGESISYEQYYATVYNKSIRERDQPLLVHKARRKGQDDEKIYLVPELCTMTGMLVFFLTFQLFINFI